MSVLVVADPLATLDPAIDATVGLMAAVQELGRAVWVCEPHELEVRAGRVHARARRVTLAARRRAGDHRWLTDPAWYDVAETARLDVVMEVDLVLLRIDPP